VAAAFSEVLAVSPVGADDDFLALGGHSLLGVQILSRLRETYQEGLGLADLFTFPTVAGLARRVEERGSAATWETPPPVRKAPPGAAIPASFGQERLWVLTQIGSTSPYYNVSSACYLDGELDAAVLDRALREVVRRHETLRTVFCERNGGPVPVVGPVPDRVLALVDLTGLPAAVRDPEARRGIAADAELAVDLEHGPILRAVLFRTAARAHLVSLVVSHAAVDGWSWGIFWRELARIYHAFSRREPSPLPDPALQYGDYALWQRTWMRGEVLERHLAFWEAHLAGAPPGPDLPCDRPRPRVRSQRGALHLFGIPAVLWARLRAFCAREGVTPYVALLAAFRVLILRLTREEDQVIGSLAANRTDRETEGTIGFFLNTLALRQRVDAGAGFRELLARVRETSLAADAHQYAPFDLVLDRLAPPRDPARHPLFDVMFVLQSPANLGTLADFAGVTARSFEVDNHSTKFDLSLILVETASALDALVEYATDLFDASTAERLAALYTALLEAALEAPEQPLCRLPWLDAAERRRLLETGSGPAADARACVLDPWGEPLPVGVPGELCTGGVEARASIPEPAGACGRTLGSGPVPAGAGSTAVPDGEPGAVARVR
jgi:hypothetical protein